MSESVSAQEILRVLDTCCDAFTFPMLDNGYVYLAATRLSAYRSAEDWALVIEVFGFSPRSKIPDTHVYAFASRLQARKQASNFIGPGAYDAYLTKNPYNESHFIYPIEEGDWRSSADHECVNVSVATLELRGHQVRLPSLAEYAKQGIQLEQPSSVRVFELCRYLAAVERERVLATPQERRVNVPPELVQVLQLEEWNHPDVVNDSARPSGSETFQQLAEVLATGDGARYRPSLPPNTHWRHWPDGGTL